MTNVIQKEIPIPVGDRTHPHPQLRRARMTAAGTFLVAHLDMGKVAEYDATGKEIWSYATPKPWAAVRLANGNTLITGDIQGYVKEVNPAGELVWDLEEIRPVRLHDRVHSGCRAASEWRYGVLELGAEQRLPTRKRGPRRCN